MIQNEHPFLFANNKRLAEKRRLFIVTICSDGRENYYWYGLVSVSSQHNIN